MKPRSGFISLVSISSAIIHADRTSVVFSREVDMSADDDVSRKSKMAEIKIK